MANPNIRTLKIAHYKKKILADYAALGIKAVFHGQEDAEHTAFSRYAMNAKEAVVTVFDLTTDESEEQVYQRARAYFQTQAQTLFSAEEDVVFNLAYQDEQFRLVCAFGQLLLAMERLLSEQEFFFILHQEHRKYLAVVRGEYAVEVIVYQKEQG